MISPLTSNGLLGTSSILAPFHRDDLSLPISARHLSPLSGSSPGENKPCIRKLLTLATILFSCDTIIYLIPKSIHYHYDLRV